MLLVIVAILLAINIAQMCVWLREPETEPTKIIKIKYHDDRLNRVSSLRNGDWYDLRSATEIEVKSGQYYMIPLGISMKIPSGYEAHIVPRSSTFERWGIVQTNSIGVIDNSFSGDNDQWHMPVYATKDKVIHFNDRICQFRIIENQPPIEFEEVADLSGKNRGGFGSTGVS